LSSYNAGDFEKAWRNALFNQFHDILPGSCVPEVRNFALGRFQDTVAMANSKKANALRKIAENIDTSRFMDENEDISDTISESAGAGVGVHLFRTGECERGNGKTRIFHVFNPSLFWPFGWYSGKKLFHRTLPYLLQNHNKCSHDIVFSLCFCYYMLINLRFIYGNQQGFG